MDGNWVKIYSSASLQKIEIVKAVLEDNQIEVVAMNKRDSSYPVFGDIELLVPRDKALQAIQIIKNDEL
jgi:hypothetical protein